MRNLTILLATLALTALASCSENKEQDDLARAQKCLNEVDQSNPGSASDCLQYVEKYDSQQANILKCGIYLTSGGLVENKMVQAANQLKDTSAVTNKEAVYMSVLSLDVPNASVGYTKAKSADIYCQASGVSGLKYLSGIIVVGTYMNKLVFDTTGSGIDITNPAAAETLINNVLNGCNDGSLTSCAAEMTTIGSAVLTLSDSYCNGSSADEKVCDDIDNAVAQAGGDTANVGEALLCYLNKKTYTNGTCT